MRNTFTKQLSKVFAVLLILATLSSCQKKGIGCPSDFKIPSISIIK